MAQLETALAADISAHRTDIEVTRQLGDLELTERLTGTPLDRRAAKLLPGPRTALALHLLSEQSAFLDPPANELPAIAFPDAATQKRPMDAARSYVIQTEPAPAQQPVIPEITLTATGGVPDRPANTP